MSADFPSAGSVRSPSLSVEPSANSSIGRVLTCAATLESMSAEAFRHSFAFDGDVGVSVPFSTGRVLTCPTTPESMSAEAFRHSFGFEGDVGSSVKFSIG